MARLQAFGIREIVVKNGPNSALVASAGAQEFVPVPEVMVPVDTMAAGDGFNAGYLAARLTGTEPAQSASAAHRLAGDVIRHHGRVSFPARTPRCIDARRVTWPGRTKIILEDWRTEQHAERRWP